jgi:hypothetical protein
VLAGLSVFFICLSSFLLLVLPLIRVRLVSTEKKWLLLLWDSVEAVWGYVDREGYFGCRGRNGWGAVVGQEREDEGEDGSS